MSKQKDYKNYYRVQLTKSGVRRWCRVHIVVAMAWIPNPNNKKEVNHKFGKKYDNRASQLEWMTRSENLEHARQNGLKRGKSKKKKNMKKLIHKSNLSNEKLDMSLYCQVWNEDRIRFTEQDNGNICVYSGCAIELTKQQIIDLAEEIKKTL